MNLTYRKANKEDLHRIIELLQEDSLGKAREHFSDEIDRRYIDSFGLIQADPNQYLMVVEMNVMIVGTCHLTIMPSLTFCGSIRLNIEAVRISSEHRSNQIGEWMMKQAIQYGRARGATIVQLTTNKERTKAKAFYERLGFEATHEGMKLYLSTEE